MTASILSVNIGKPTTGDWTGTKGATGIDKRPVVGAVRFEPLGVKGDHVIDTSVHGGADQAVYAYADEDARWWAAALNREVMPGNFGENLTTAGIDINECVVGERWRVGEVVLEVSRPRIPCRVFAGFWNLPDLIKRFTERAHPGSYLRVLQAGSFAAGAPVEVIDRPAHGVTIGVTFRALTLEPELLPRLLDAPALPVALREKAARRTAPA